MDEVNQVRKCIVNTFQEILPVRRILSTLSIINVAVLKNFGNNVENIIEKIHDLGEIVLYMISFENLFKEEKDN